MSSEEMSTDVALSAKPEPAPRRSCYRVNYYVRGQVKTAFVVAYSGGEASAFLGVNDGSATAASVAYPVEVAGVDPSHDALPALPTVIAEPPAEPQLSQEELARLREILRAQ